MNLPTVEEVEQLWDEYHVPERVRKHCRAVTRVAVFLAKKLKEKGIHVDVGLVERSCLLHDLTRTSNFESFEDHENSTDDDVEFWKDLHRKYGHLHHADSAADVLKEKYPEVAEVVASHGFSNKSHSSVEGWSWEVKLINYADWRIIHDKIGTLKERFEDSDKRHHKFYVMIKNESGLDYRKIAEEIAYKLEEEIFSKLEIKPEDITEETV